MINYIHNFLKKIKFYRTTFFILFCLNILTFYATKVTAQKIYLKIIFTDNNTSIKTKKISNDSAIIQNELQRITKKYKNHGHLAISVDTLIKKGDTLTAFIHSGKKTQWEISTDNEIIRKLKLFKHQKINNYTEIDLAIKTILIYYENNGFPFAKVNANYQSLSDTLIKIDIEVQEKIKCYFNKPIIKGELQISDNFIQNYFKIKDNAIYNESLIKQIHTKILANDFINEIKPTEIEFNKNKATVYLYLNKKKANTISGLLGFANEKNSDKIILNGEINLGFNNVFHSGENLNLYWKRLQTSSQKLNIAYYQPYPFKLPFAFDLNLTIEKIDSTILNTKTNIGCRIIKSGNNYLKISYENRKSSLIKQVLSNKKNIKLNYYGLENYYEKTDYKFNPQNGIIGKLNFLAGTKNTDTISSTQYEIESDISLFFQIKYPFIVKLQNQSGLIYNEKSIYENELIKLGSIKKLRGFDEESILTSLYSIISIEFRYIFEKNSFFYTFADFCYYEKKIVNSLTTDKPYSFGIGVNFETRAGIFSVAYAIGKQLQNSLNISKGKIHLGIVYLF